MFRDQVVEHVPGRSGGPLDMLLDDVARLRYRLVMQNVTEVMLEIYAQTLATGFAPETWRTQGHTLVERILATPGGQWFWTTFGDN